MRLDAIRRGWYHFGFMAVLLLPISYSSAGAEGPSADEDIFAGITLVDQNNRALTLSQLKGHTVVLNFMYIDCHASCSTELQQLVEVSRSISLSSSQSIHFVTVSVDPNRDTPKRLKAYAEAIGADQANWSFLTGHPTDIGRLAQKLRAFNSTKLDLAQHEHTTTVLLFDRNGRLMQRYSGVPVDVLRLVREIPLLDAIGAKTTSVVSAGRVRHAAK